MKLCCIDVGTNSVLFLLSRIDSIGRITPLEFHAETTRLGKDLRKKGILDKKAQKRTISAIRKYMKGADKYLIVGTSALREAKDRKKFGLPVKILSTGEEAGLVFSSVKHFLKPLPEKVVICDIGGGSTEFIFCISGRAVKKFSIPIGAVNLTERFKDNITEMESFIKTKIEPHRGFRLIAVGGTVTIMAAILKRLRYYDPNKVHRYVVPYDKVTDILKKLHSYPLDKRRRIISFDPKRADIIVAGLCILKVIMELFSVNKVKICDRGLVYGLAVNYSKYTRGTFNLHKTS